MNLDILLAHPLKHHAFNLAVGCQKSGVDFKLLTPLYKVGIAKLLSMLPGSIGKKVKGYFNDDLDSEIVISPVYWQLKRVFFSWRNVIDFQEDFDIYVEGLIRDEKIRPKVLITLQDYMPKTVIAAKRLGIIIWSDQISNRSQKARLRIENHFEQLAQDNEDTFIEDHNNRILQLADLCSAPSKYAAESLISRINQTCKINIVPYGVDTNNFIGKKRVSENRIRLLARANSVKKGGHLLLEAIEQCGMQLLKLAKGKSIEINIVGTLDSYMQNRLANLTLPHGIRINSKIIPSLEVVDEFAQSDLFIMPSLSESMSLMCIEAMQMGLPLIITKECGVDCFLNNQMGVEVESNVESVCHGILYAFENMHLWSLWRATCKKNAADLSWSTYEKNISQLAYKVINN